MSNIRRKLTQVSNSIDGIVDSFQTYPKMATGKKNFHFMNKIRRHNHQKKHSNDENENENVQEDSEPEKPTKKVSEMKDIAFEVDMPDKPKQNVHPLDQPITLSHGAKVSAETGEVEKEEKEEKKGKE